MIPIRKSVLELNEQDLRSYPIWEFCTDEEDVEGQDETTVRPSSLSELEHEEPGSYILAADFSLACGLEISGYVYSGRANDFGCTQPNAIFKDSQINFYLGSLEYLDDPEKLVSSKVVELGLTAPQLFPLAFTTRKNIKGMPLTGNLPGFIARHPNGRFVAIT